ncbi:GNAT family N-acetyltransferase [Izhakiella australiensis]|nr:GNAT family N-acetyltransferase [Izhakiella australiensis]
MKVNLRPWQDEHAAEFSHAVISSLDTLKPWMIWASEDFGASEAKRWFAITHHLRATGQAEEFGLFTDDGYILGGAGIRFPQQMEILPSIGYWVRSSEQRKGIATAAVRALLEMAFTRPEIEKVEILAAEANIASRTVAIRAGGELTAIRYGLIVLDSGPVNTAIYHISRR